MSVVVLYFLLLLQLFKLLGLLEDRLEHRIVIVLVDKLNWLLYYLLIEFILLFIDIYILHIGMYLPLRLEKVLLYLCLLFSHFLVYGRYCISLVRNSLLSSMWVFLGMKLPVHCMVGWVVPNPVAWVVDLSLYWVMIEWWARSIALLSRCCLLILRLKSVCFINLLFQRNSTIDILRYILVIVLMRWLEELLLR